MRIEDGISLSCQWEWELNIDEDSGEDACNMLLYDEGEMMNEGCCYPGQCLMLGPHLKGECHTVEMIESEEEDSEC